MKIYFLKFSEFSEPYHIFGYIDPSTLYVETQKVPKKYAETWGQKNGINHFDIFGYLSTGSEYTWRCIGNTVEWYSEPNQEIKHKVEEHLLSKYNKDKVQHYWP